MFILVKDYASEIMATTDTKEEMKDRIATLIEDGEYVDDFILYQATTIPFEVEDTVKVTINEPDSWRAS